MVASENPGQWESHAYLSPTTAAQHGDVVFLSLIFTPLPNGSPWAGFSPEFPLFGPHNIENISFN